MTRVDAQSRRGKAFRCACRWNTDGVSETRIGD